MVKCRCINLTVILFMAETFVRHCCQCDGENLPIVRRTSRFVWKRFNTTRPLKNGCLLWTRWQQRQWWQRQPTTPQFLEWNMWSFLIAILQAIRLGVWTRHFKRIPFWLNWWSPTKQFAAKMDWRGEGSRREVGEEGVKAETWCWNSGWISWREKKRMNLSRALLRSKDFVQKRLLLPPPPLPLLLIQPRMVASFLFLSPLGGGSHKLLTSALTEPVVLIRDYFRYLVLSHGFVVTDLEAVLFSKMEPIFHQIFWELIERRRSSRDSKEKKWIKHLVNLSCGFFGFQSEEATLLPASGRSGFRCFSICSHIPHAFNLSSHQIDFHQGVICLGGTQYYIVSFSNHCHHLRRRCGPSNKALALFFNVVEIGKPCLVQALQFFSRHLSPASWSLLNSNVDNVIIALEGASSLEETVFLGTSSNRMAWYLAEKRLYVAATIHEVEPGQLKLEWLCNLSF